MQQSHEHHYVPKWYQRRFLHPGQQQFYYLDLSPEAMVSEGGARYQRRALLRWGPKRCFYQHDLYTVKLGNWATDEIEKRFFGPIDWRGQKAVEFFADYDSYRDGVHDSFNHLMSYMDAQRFRTPRGLDRLRASTDVRNHNLTLLAMQRAFQFHITMWTEGVWEIVRARQSPTKFIVTDEPVTFFNAKAFPGSRDCSYPSDVGLGEIGTRTLFPLGMDACLMITHVQLVRDPWANPRRSRVNARAYQQTMASLLDIQFGRELEEDEVIRINLILKRRATRYIAAAEEEWLSPESKASATLWSKLDDDWFLLPHLYKVPFSGGITIGYKGGGAWAMDEYGRRPFNPEYQDKRLHDREWISHLRAQEAWARKREGKSVAHVDKFNSDDSGDKIMQGYLDEIKQRRND
jgi:hypothetical protein